MSKLITSTTNSLYCTRKDFCCSPSDHNDQNTQHKHKAQNHHTAIEDNRQPNPTQGIPSNHPKEKMYLPLAIKKNRRSTALDDYEKQREMHDLVEKELVDSVCLWCYRFLVYLIGAAAFVLFLEGKENYINPSSVALASFLMARFFSGPSQLSIALGFLTLMVVKHSLSQGCSASLVPSIYAFMPTASAFLHRSRRAVILSTAGALTATMVIYSVDISGQCSTEAIDKDDKVAILADRFLPLLFSILGNGVLLLIIVGQSQRSMLLHVEAATSAANLADVRRDVLHRVTHELRTPLNGIVGSVELLTSSETLNSEDMENALTIKNCLNTIVDICDNVLLAAKSSLEEKQERPKATFRLASTIDAISEIFTATAAANGVALKTEYLTSDVWVQGLAVELRQVLVNLVGNALKFTESGRITVGVIEVTRPPSSPKTSTVTCRFEVEDTGIGINMNSKDMLFEAFHQGEFNAVSRKHKGTGLGLTICKDFVKKMGGDLDVEGEQGRGTRFWFTLELEKVSCPHEENYPVSSKPCRVLIADPERGSSVSCQNMIKSASPTAEICSVGSVQELLKAVSKKSYGMNDIHQIAVLDCDSLDSDTLEKTLMLIREAGWHALAFCSHSNFGHLVQHAGAAHAVFRRPLPLLRIHRATREILNGKPLAATSLHDRKIPLGVTELKQMGLKKKSRRTLVEGSNKTVGQDTQDSEDKDKRDPNEASAGKGLSCLSGQRPVGDPQPARKGPPKRSMVDLGPRAKIIVVDDTSVNVKVLSKMLGRSTTAPILSCMDGQSAVEIVTMSSPEDQLLFLMDWHMPGMCGLTASETICEVVQDRGYPNCHICMVTADVEGLRLEMTRRQIEAEGTVSKGVVSMTGNIQDASRGGIISLVAEKPITFKSVGAILEWFRDNKDTSAVIPEDQ